MQNREDFERCLFGYLDPLKRHVSPRAARVQLADGSAQYEDEVISMEAWARPLWGLAPFWAGGGRSADGFYERIYPAGLAAGTDPACPEYWGRCRDHDQMFVEMAAIAYGLLLAPDVLWEPLPEDARVRVASWLFQVNEHTFPAGNWLWFRVLVNLALRELGCAHDGGAIQADLDTLDSYYEGNGWCKDGPTGLPDYYNAMTFQFFSLLYIGWFGASDPARASRYSERARLFAEDYARLFSARGEGVPYGRSMTYRFAQAGFWSMAAAVKIDLGAAFAPGALKGLIARNIQAWDEHAICDNGGVLTIATSIPTCIWQRATMLPGRRCGASWRLHVSRFPQMMSFGLAGHRRCSPGMRLSRLPLPALHLCGAIRLERSCSIRAGACRAIRSLSPIANIPSSSIRLALAFVFRAPSVRSRRPLPIACSPLWWAGASTCATGWRKARLRRTQSCPRWSPCAGIEVETRIEPCVGGHMRTHRVASEIACEAYDCGFAVPGDYHRVDLVDASRLCRVEFVGAVPGKGVLIKNEANTNISCGKTVIPAVRYIIEVGTAMLVTRIETGE